MGSLLFRKHRQHASEVCWLSAKGAEPAIHLTNKPLCHSLLLKPLLTTHSSQTGPCSGHPPVVLWHSIPTSYSSSSGITFHPDSTEDTSLSCVKAGSRDPTTSGKTEASIEENPSPFSCSGLIYQRYFSASIKLSSENRIFFPGAIGPAEILAIVNLTKHRTFLPILIICWI